MRLRGQVPSMVVLNDTFMPQWGADDRGNWWVHVERTENPDRLDLRFLKGMTVFIFTDNATRRELLEAACAKVGVKVLGAEHGAMA
jgi:hypothetical protein